MIINTIVKQAQQWIINPLRLFIYRLSKAPFEKTDDRGGCRQAPYPHCEHPFPLLKFPLKTSLQTVKSELMVDIDYRLMLLENKEQLNGVLVSLENAVPVGGGNFLITGRYASDVIHNFSVARSGGYGGSK